MATILYHVVALVLAAAAVRAVGPYGDKPIRGVNLGGWLVLEKWITPQLFAGLPSTVRDEYTFCQHFGQTEALKRLEAHWKSWVTEDDIVRLRDAGIDHLRIPIGYWAFEVRKGKPWVTGSWAYAMKAVGWAKKYGMRVMIVLHGAPGSQNGNDHSGRIGPINFFNSDANLQSATRVIGKIAHISNSPEWRTTISMIELLNEPILWQDYNYRLQRLKQYYKMAYDEVRKYNTLAVVVVHDAFIDFSNWYYLSNGTTYYGVMLDTHYYQVFGDQYQNLTCDQHHAKPCEIRQKLKESNQKLWTVVGEWSLATPKKCPNEGYFARQQIGVFEENGSGWFMWAHKNGQGWTQWDFLESNKQGWINLKNGTIASKC